MSAIFDETLVTYVKWDFNRNICEKFSSVLDAQSQGEFSHRYVLGLYRVLETLTAKYPHILFEGCSGGGRFDAGMLYYTPQIWCSDNTDAIARLTIQYGTSFGYELDITKMSEEEREQVRKQICRFKERYDLIQRGEYY